MRRKVAFVSTLIRCGIVGGGYGAVLGVIHGLLLGVVGAMKVEDVTLFDSLIPFAILSGALLGFPAGFLSGVFGCCLGGPVGCAIGGMIGTYVLTYPHCPSGKGLMTLTPYAFYPCVWGAAFGIVMGLHIKRRVPLFPGVEWLADSIYTSPLGGWFGWREQPKR